MVGPGVACPLAGVASQLEAICAGTAECPSVLRGAPYVAMGKVAEWLRSLSQRCGRDEALEEALGLADTIINRLPANGEHWSLIQRYGAAVSAYRALVSADKEKDGAPAVAAPMPSTAEASAALVSELRQIAGHAGHDFDRVEREAIDQAADLIEAAVLFPKESIDGD